MNEPRAILDLVLSRAREHGPRGVLAFDLDSTLFDNRPRQAMILREFGEAAKVPLLRQNAPHHWKSGWDMRGAMIATGLSEADADALLPQAKGFWRERFFTSEYCQHDIAMDGAEIFLAEAKRTGATLAYLTGRHEAMRRGTEASMSRAAMPLPDRKAVHLIMKPALDDSDDAFKAAAHARLRILGQVLAAFDNEPTHANDYRKSFPEAIVVHLATDHSGRPVPLLDGIVSIPDFRRSPLPLAPPRAGRGED